MDSRRQQQQQRQNQHQHHDQHQRQHQHEHVWILYADCLQEELADDADALTLGSPLLCST